MKPAGGGGGKCDGGPEERTTLAAKSDRDSWASFRTHAAAAVALRAVLLAYGEYQDAAMMMTQPTLPDDAAAAETEAKAAAGSAAAAAADLRQSTTAGVKFTDVDYRVFTDAARHVWEGRSPYDRHTYRYTPVLAWMLVPNVALGCPVFGKVLFCAFDIVAAALIFASVRNSSAAKLGEEQLFSGQPPKTALTCAWMWLYNPLVMAVSCRGNAESVVVVLVLATVWLHQEGLFLLSGAALGAAVHFKLYPIVYALPLYSSAVAEHTFRTGSGQSSSYVAGLLRLNRARLRLVLGAVGTLAALTGACYAAYGVTFLEEAYLHHVSRRDTRHNFSVYFYMLYLTVEEDDVGISLLTFLPQVLLLAAISVKFGARRTDVPFCLFAQTFVFVAYNKVVTSQYFLWYLALLPLVWPQLGLTLGEALTALLLWGFAQASWLLPAYFLEFKGYNTFQFIWIESMAFFAANIGLLAKFVRKYREFRARSKLLELEAD